MSGTVLGIEDRNLECRDLIWGDHNLVNFSFVYPASGDVRLGNFDQTCLEEHLKKQQNIFEGIWLPSK